MSHLELPTLSAHLPAVVWCAVTFRFSFPSVADGGPVPFLDLLYAMDCRVMAQKSLKP